MSKLSISDQNEKMGKVPNVSLPSGKTCVKGVECFKTGCYARRLEERLPIVKAAWNNNLLVWCEDHDDYFTQIALYLKYHKPQLFRFHVGGDIPGQRYLDRMKLLAEQVPKTQFLCFTKRYTLDYAFLPSNLRIILSTWPGIEVPENTYNLPMAWLTEDWRRPFLKMYLMCPGKCWECEHKCWSLVSQDIPVFFKRH